MKRYGFGVDIGGTTCKIGLFQEDGTLMEKWEIKTNKEHQGQSILTDLTGEIQRIMQVYGLSATEIMGVGVGIPGPVEMDGTVNGCVNLGWGRRNVPAELEAVLGVPVFAGNDANVAALGELLYGCGRGKNSLVMITMGTGVGGGIVDNKRILCGANGAAGEIGHIIVNENETEHCNCGRRGCLEQYVSATGIQKIARRHLEQGKEETVLTLENVDAKEVFQAAKAGDHVAKVIVQEVCAILGKAMANMAVILDPEVFALGGGVSNAGDFLAEEVRREYKKYVFDACKDTSIVIATLGNDAGIYGGMGLLKENQ